MTSDSMSVKRRLSCILAADAVGYSAHMSRDEIGTVRLLSAHRAVIDGIITFHEGRIIGTAGDSVLAEFSSVVEAVRCAVEIQEAIKTRNDSLPAVHQMLFRVGINLGDVVVRDNDLLGDGINVAARLETLAEPGGICISSGVYDQITGKLDLGFQDIGQQNLKNILRPIHVYRISGTRRVEVVPEVAPSPPPSPAPRRGHGWKAGLAGASALFVVGSVAVWQAGWIRVGARDTAAPQSTSPVASPAAATLPAAVTAPAATANVAGTQAAAPPLAAQTQGMGPTNQSPAPKARATEASATQVPGPVPVQNVMTRETISPRGTANSEYRSRPQDIEYAKARAEALAGRSARSMRTDVPARTNASPDSGLVWRRKSGNATMPEPQPPRGR